MKTQEYEIAIGYGKYVLVRNEGIHTSKICKRVELGVFDTREKASAALYYAKEDAAIKGIIAEWKAANDACRF